MNVSFTNLRRCTVEPVPILASLSCVRCSVSLSGRISSDLSSQTDEISIFFPFFQTLFMVNRPSARISDNHSPSYPHMHTRRLLYLWHYFKNGFLRFEENVNRGTREAGRRSERERKEERGRREECSEAGFPVVDSFSL